MTTVISRQPSLQSLAEAGGGPRSIIATQTTTPRNDETLCRLAPELILEIAGYLSIADLKNLSLTCTSIRVPILRRVFFSIQLFWDDPERHNQEFPPHLSHYVRRLAIICTGNGFEDGFERRALAQTLIRGKGLPNCKSIRLKFDYGEGFDFSLVEDALEKIKNEEPASFPFDFRLDNPEACIPSLFRAIATNTRVTDLILEKLPPWDTDKVMINEWTQFLEQIDFTEVRPLFSWGVLDDFAESDHWVLHESLRHLGIYTKLCKNLAHMKLTLFQRKKDQMGPGLTHGNHLGLEFENEYDLMFRTLRMDRLKTLILAGMCLTNDHFDLIGKRARRLRHLMFERCALVQKIPPPEGPRYSVQDWWVSMLGELDGVEIQTCTKTTVAFHRPRLNRRTRPSILEVLLGGRLPGSDDDFDSDSSSSSFVAVEDDEEDDEELYQELDEDGDQEEDEQGYQKADDGDQGAN